MKKDIVQVRKDIAKRKQQKLPSVKNDPKVYRQNLSSHVLQDEEKHGYMPTHFPTTGKKQEDTSAFFSSFIFKTIIAASIFFILALVNQVDHSSLSKPKEWTTSALTEEFPFATVNQWYQTTFGSPLAFTDQSVIETAGDAPVLPVNGTISQSFQVNGESVFITSEETSDVYAMEQGTVIFAGNDNKTNKTIIIQHPDKSKSIYGNLSDFTVNQYQFVNTNQIIGEFIPSVANESKLYFAVEKNNTYLDPVKVMKVDENP
ncbi:M23 family metallopeptidase [Paraliobacillus sediminis]|uniref:M23 family metallopeptidase n=1 Tax=Paraliobacillus sediminis TaxID=1885916 RepID=UPI000E3D3B05|nr:M23 family metallopeptidase [Paraliobacillus sediminis]